MLDGMTVLSVCFLSLFFSSGLVYFAPFHLHLIPWAMELGGCLYSFLLFLEYWMWIHDDIS